MLTSVPPDNRFFIPPHKNANFQTTDDLWNLFCIRSSLEALDFLCSTMTTCLDFYSHLAQKRKQFAQEQSHYHSEQQNPFGLMRVGPNACPASFRSVDDTLVTDASRPGAYDSYWELMRLNITGYLPVSNHNSYQQQIAEIPLTNIYFNPSLNKLGFTHTRRENLPILFEQHIEPLFRLIINRSIPVTLNHFAHLAWLLAHATPCMRGSAAITQMTLFALMLYRGIEPIYYRANMIDLDALTLPISYFITVFARRLGTRSL